MDRDVTQQYELENLRRSLVASNQPEGQPSGITAREVVQLIAHLQRLEQLRSGVSDLLQANSPVPRQNAQLRILCRDLARLLHNITSPRS